MLLLAALLSLFLGAASDESPLLFRAVVFFIDELHGEEPPSYFSRHPNDLAALIVNFVLDAQLLAAEFARGFPSTAIRTPYPGGIALFEHMHQWDI